MANSGHRFESFDPNLPLERAHTIPNTWYFDPAIYAAEKQAVFGTTWLMAGRAEQVREPGAFATVDIAGEPIFILCDSEGVLRSFSNVCRHRAAPLLTQPHGKASKLRCRYHGWTYDLTGHLRGAPEFDGVEDFCKEEIHLPVFTAEEWAGWIWIHLDANPPPLTDFLHPLPAHAAELHFDTLRFVARREYELACNWKVFVDNYLDGGYHVNTVHPSLAGVIDYSRYRTEINGHTSVQIAPLRPPDKPAEAAIGAVRAGETAYYWWIFPNFMINVYRGVMDTNLVLPLGPERCRVIFDFYFADTEGPAARQFMEDSLAAAHQIQLEDSGICEEVQRGLMSRSFSTGRFSVRREGAAYHFHQLLGRRLQSLARS